jgi:hypothetical protein
MGIPAGGETMVNINCQPLGKPLGVMDYHGINGIIIIRKMVGMDDYNWDNHWDSD